MPEMWLSLRTRSIISHLKLTHLKAICKCSSICRTCSEGREIPFPFNTRRLLQGPTNPEPHRSAHTTFKYSVEYTGMERVGEGERQAWDPDGK